MFVKPKAGQPAKIKVVGVGGGGGNAISMMISQEDIIGVEFIAINTDAQSLLNNKADTKIQIGENLTKGLGSGGDPDIGFQAAEESKEIIKENLTGSDMVFIAAGEGGGTGTGASPVIAQISKDLGALTVAVVTKPFVFEGSRRKNLAEDGVSKLEDKVDTLIVIPNQKILEIIDPKVSIIEAFRRIDSILHQGVKGIAELITTPGLINVDFADVRSIMANAGTALMGIGTASGEKRTIQAIKQAITSPLLETSIEGAKGVLFNVIGGPDLSMIEIDEAASIVAKTVAPDAEIIFGAVVDQKMVDNVKVIIIATRIKAGPERRHYSSSQIRNRKDDSASSEDKKDNKKVTSLYDQEESVEMIDDETEFDIPTFLRKK